MDSTLSVQDTKRIRDGTNLNRAIVTVIRIRFHIPKPVGVCERRNDTLFLASQII